MSTNNQTVFSQEALNQIITKESWDFLSYLHRMFQKKRKLLLDLRQSQQARLNAGVLPDFDPMTAAIRGDSWQVASAPSDLEDRRVEITGPCDQKMMINALNSGAKVFMADLEDAQSPTLSNVIEGQINLYKAVRFQIDFTSDSGKNYKLNDNVATLLVRPRGWHLDEAHFLVDDEPISASIFDFGLYFFHNAKELIKRGSGPYFYLPKLESYHEARLWNEIFIEAQNYLNIPQSTIRATVLIETIMAAFQMEEILFELKDHVSGLNAGRWDYIFSMIKRLRQSKIILPDRHQITMNVPFMKSYAALLVKSCHIHGAHAIGGMSAFIPNRNNPQVTQTAILAVQADKRREVQNGFDGTWVAHPDLVPVAKAIFDETLGTYKHQKHIKKENIHITGADLLPQKIAEGKITESGLRNNIRVALQYIENWLKGTGAVAINNLMEDAATAEISRAQIWQWIYQGACLDDGRPCTKEMYLSFSKDELEQLKQLGMDCSKAASILDELILKDDFSEFLTLNAYPHITASQTINSHA